MSGLASTCAWVDDQAGWTPGTARAKVADRWSRLDVQTVHERSARRAGISREAMVRTLGEYYGGDALHRVRFGRKSIATTITTRPEWLSSPPDKAMFVAPQDVRGIELDDAATQAVIERLAEGIVLDTQDRAVFGASRLTEYAVTSGLLAAELADSVTCKENMPLRDRWLPDLATALDLGGRPCVSRVTTLYAFARRRSEPSYVLVVPDGFHRPMIDPRADFAIEETVRREFEEQLPHPNHLPEPMRWLTEHDALHIARTGFGITLVNGNYEFTALAAIDDPEFWGQYGDVWQTNREATGLRLCSTRDRAALTDLLADESRSSAELFALLQGLEWLNSNQRTP
ncbi:hypothetical protein [Sciscionella marina]|uniref:hypothetical protein n=1 Tax=Sciscionella marina TaxID=508770 RepID=UPI0003607219|nr:hypothetical protein [Sciscionella marina]